MKEKEERKERKKEKKSSAKLKEKINTISGIKLRIIFLCSSFVINLKLFCDQYTEKKQQKTKFRVYINSKKFDHGQC